MPRSVLALGDRRVVTEKRRRLSRSRHGILALSQRSAERRESGSIERLIPGPRRQTSRNGKRRRLSRSRHGIIISRNGGIFRLRRRAAGAAAAGVFYHGKERMR